MKRILAALALTGLLTSVSSASAAPKTWAIDPNHSTVGFTIRHFFGKVPGSFGKFSGAVVYDAEKPESSSATVEIDASTINTNNSMRDGDLRGEEFFDVEKFPTIKFVSTKVVKTGDNQLSVEGNLTMRGVTKPVTLAVTFLGSGPGFNGEMRAGFDASTKINRKDYGIIWNKTLDQGGTMLGDDVDIKIGIEGVIRPPQPPKK